MFSSRSETQVFPAKWELLQQKKFQLVKRKYLSEVMGNLFQISPNMKDLLRIMLSAKEDFVNERHQQMREEIINKTGPEDAFFKSLEVESYPYSVVSSYQIRKLGGRFCKLLFAFWEIEKQPAELQKNAQDAAREIFIGLCEKVWFDSYLRAYTQQKEVQDIVCNHVHAKEIAPYPGIKKIAKALGTSVSALGGLSNAEQQYNCKKQSFTIEIKMKQLDCDYETDRLKQERLRKEIKQLLQKKESLLGVEAILMKQRALVEEWRMQQGEEYFAQKIDALNQMEELIISTIKKAETLYISLFSKKNSPDNKTASKRLEMAEQYFKEINQQMSHFFSRKKGTFLLYSYHAPAFPLPSHVESVSLGQEIKEEQEIYQYVLDALKHGAPQISPDAATLSLKKREAQTEANAQNELVTQEKAVLVRNESILPSKETAKNSLKTAERVDPQKKKKTCLCSCFGQKERNPSIKRSESTQAHATNHNKYSLPSP